MKRVLSLVLVLVMVLSAIVPAFAEETASQEALDLETYGLITGNGTDLDEASPLTRAEMTVILAKLYGKAEEAVAYDIPNTLTDIEDHWAKAWISYSFDNEWMVGDEAGTFRPEDPISTQEVNTLMLKVLGYFTSWETANEDAATQEIAVEAADASLVLRGEIFKTLRAALDMPKKDATDTLGTELALTDYVAPVTEPEVVELAVKEVVAENLKSMTIEFNKEIDEDYLDNITLDPASTLTLLEDNMTVSVVYDAAVAQGATVEIEIDEEDGLAYEWSARVYDMADPVILAVAANSPKELELTFSEPVDFDETTSFKVYNNITRDSIALVAKVTDNDLDTAVVTLELPSLLAAGTYEFEVTEVADYAGFEIADATFDVVIAKDEAAPVAVSAEVKNLTTIEITFDETIATKGTFEVDGVDETGDTVIDGKVATITVPELTLAATVEVQIIYEGQKDLVGNEVEDAVTITTSVEDDVTLPEATLVLEEGNDVTITFTKTMLTTAGTITVNDADDEEVVVLNVSALTFKADTNNTVLEIEASDLVLDDVDPADFTIVLEDMKDATVRKNLLPDATFSIYAEDTLNPTIETTYLLIPAADADDEDEVVFYFSEAMDQTLLENLSNYIVAGDDITVANIDDAAFVSMGADGKSVTLSIPGAQAANDDYILIGLKDIAGNIAATETVDKETDDDIDVASVVATDENTIVVTFDATVASADPSAFYLATGLLTDDATENLVFTAASVDGTEVTFTVDGDLPADLGTWKLIANNTELIVNLYGNDLEDNFPTVADTITYADGKVITDEIVPTVVLEDVADADTTLTLTFAEDIEVNDTDINAYDFTTDSENLQFVLTVNGDVVDITGVTSTASDEITITVAGGDAFAADDEIVIAYYASTTATRNLEDTSDNAVANFSLSATAE